MAMLKVPLTPLDHRIGDPDAPVELVEYGDYQCPYCAMAQPIVAELVRNFGNDLTLVFRHFPLTEVHPQAQMAAESAEFAGAHGMFWQMHDMLFANQARLSLPVVFAIAERLNLSTTELREALASGRYADKVRNDFMGGVRSGVNGTPCFFINGVRHDGAYSFPALAAAIAAARPSPSAVDRYPAEGPRP
jgi:protein-disulfide isomerase